MVYIIWGQGQDVQMQKKEGFLCLMTQNEYDRSTVYRS